MLNLELFHAKAFLQAPLVSTTNNNISNNNNNNNNNNNLQTTIALSSSY